MSIMKKVVDTVAHVMPDRERDRLTLSGQTNRSARRSRQGHGRCAVFGGVPDRRTVARGPRLQHDLEGCHQEY